METHDFSNAKVGDKVSHPIYGNGVIVELDHSEWPIDVDFTDNACFSFTLKGKEHESDIIQSLYHGHNTFQIIATPVSPYKEGAWIAVSDDNKFWFIRQFVKMRQDSLIVAKSKYTDDGDILWKYSKSLKEI